MSKLYENKYFFNKSFGTVLRDHPDVDQIAKKCFTFKMPKEVDVSILPTNFNKYTKYLKEKKPIKTRFLIPDTFDGKNVWGDYIASPDYLGKCGLGWVQNLVDCLIDRYCIFSLGQLCSILSTTEVVMCGDLVRPSIIEGVKSQSQIDYSISCNGYSVYDAAKYIIQNGISTARCFSLLKLEENKYKTPLDFKDTEDIKKVYPTCSVLLGDQYEHCLDKDYAKRIIKMVNIINIDNDINSIKYELLKYGPVVGGFLMYDDFVNEYDGKTIYTGPSENSKPLGGHTIAIVGWGKDKKTDTEYWICSNDWTSDWGLGGYFKMKMNIKECMLEQNVTAPIIDFSIIDNKNRKEDPRIFKIPSEWSDKNPPDTDPTTLYTKYTKQLIMNNNLEGSLQPIIKKDLLPKNYDVFWACDIDLFIRDTGMISAKQKISIKNILLSMFSGILLSILFYVINNRKKEIQIEHNHKILDNSKSLHISNFFY